MVLTNVLQMLNASILTVTILVNVQLDLSCIIRIIPFDVKVSSFSVCIFNYIDQILMNVKWVWQLVIRMVNVTISMVAITVSVIMDIHLLVKIAVLVS